VKAVTISSGMDLRNIGMSNSKFVTPEDYPNLFEIVRWYGGAQFAELLIQEIIAYGKPMPADMVIRRIIQAGFYPHEARYMVMSSVDHPHANF
jgi:hypothetical protein